MGEGYTGVQEDKNGQNTREISIERDRMSDVLCVISVCVYV